jgi:hypothetical protein
LAGMGHYCAPHVFAIDGRNQKFENPIIHSGGRSGEK